MTKIVRVAKITPISCGVNVLELLRLKGAVFSNVELKSDEWVFGGTIGEYSFDLPLSLPEGHTFLSKIVGSNKDVKKDIAKRTKEDARVMEFMQGATKLDKKPRAKKTKPPVPIDPPKFKQPQRTTPNTGNRSRLTPTGKELLSKFKEKQPLRKNRRNAEELREVDIAYSYLLDEQYDLVQDWTKSWG